MPKSALRKSGSTRPWRRRRSPLVAELRARGSLQCAAIDRSPKCLGTITNPRDLVAGHPEPRYLGGTDEIIRPECRPCSDYQGGKLTHAAQKLARQPPERKW